MPTFLDALGQQVSQRELMEQELARVEEENLLDAYQELQRRRGQRQRPGGLGLAFKSQGATDYFRRQGNESDAAFLRSYLQSGERPRVRVGYAATEGESPEDEAFGVQQLLLKQRLKERGF